MKRVNASVVSNGRPSISGRRNISIFSLPMVNFGGWTNSGTSRSLTNSKNGVARGESIAFDAFGGVVMTGTFTGTLKTQDAALTAFDGKYGDIFFTRFEKDSHVFLSSVSTAGSARVVTDVNANLDANTNPTTKVVARFGPNDWRRQGHDRVIRYLPLVFRTSK